MSERKRVISLLAGATETVTALGCRDWLVGRSHECDYPDGVRNLPQCTAPKFATDGASYRIDQRVKAIIQEGLSVYRVDADLLDRLRPDVIITQTQCEVCAVSERDVLEAVAAMVASRPQIVSVNPNALVDIWNDISRISRALDVHYQGMELISKLKRRINDIAAVAAACPERPRVACIEWIDPLMAAGNWMPELITMAGGISIFGTPGKHSPRFDWRMLRDADPDVILVFPCGWDIERTRGEMPSLRARDGWADLQAVRSHQVYLLDGNRYFNRPGPSIVESMEILAEIFHPQRFNFDHQHSGWEQFSIISD